MTAKSDAITFDLDDKSHAPLGRLHMTDLFALRNAIIARYGLLFPPRSLACRKCLNLRYGEVR